jgi:hypothetical protein
MTLPIGKHGLTQNASLYWRKSASNIRYGNNLLGEMLIMFNQDFKEFIESLNVHFIDLEHLKQNKKASGRLQDLADLENLE